MADRQETVIEEMDRLYPEEMARARAAVRADHDADAQQQYDQSPELQELLRIATQSKSVRRGPRQRRTE